MGGVVLLATLMGLVVTLVAAPFLWFGGNRRSLWRLLAGWGIYSIGYLTVSTGIALAESRTVETRAVGQEVCADSGCFAVDRVDKVTAGTDAAYTLSWHLASTDTHQTKRFPGRGLEVFLFDERGRMFRQGSGNQDPLDVIVPAGESVHQSMTFTVPADARDLFLTAKYRPFTFQSLLPGTLSLVPHKPTAMIRIQ